MLMRIGFFKEFFLRPSDYPWLPSIKDAITCNPPSDENRLVEYLSAGNYVASVMEALEDVLTGELFKESGGCSSLLTDGLWLWRQDLSHYVRRHHVRLPDEFILHIRSNLYLPPVLSEAELVALAVSEKSIHGPDWWVVAKVTG